MIYFQIHGISGMVIQQYFSSLSLGLNSFVKTGCESPLLTLYISVARSCRFCYKWKKSATFPTTLHTIDIRREHWYSIFKALLLAQLRWIHTKRL